MIPVILDPERCRLILVGRGETAARRTGQLLEGGARDLLVFSDAPSPALEERAAGRLRRRLPDAGELSAAAAVWIVDLESAAARDLANLTRAVGTLVNVEDVKALCDYHSPSIVRRGDLLLTVSTKGRSPGLAVRIRRHLERMFGPEWAGRLDRLSAERDAWRSAGAPLGEVARRTEDYIARQGWL